MGILAKSRSQNVVSFWFDACFFWGAPILAYVLAWGIRSGIMPNPIVQIGSQINPFWEIWVMVFMTQSHLFIVVFRAYFNPQIFGAYRKRLIWTPILIFLACMVSKWALVSLVVINTWWDAYHSSLQTFGIGRLFDRAYKNDVLIARCWDFGLALVAYMGPLLGGVLFMDHVWKFENFRSLNSVFFTSIPVFVGGFSGFISQVVIAFGSLYICLYLLKYIQLYRNGYVIPWQKVMLYLSTAGVSLSAWGFNSFGMAFIIVNFFHAWQYFGIMIWAEKENLVKTFRLSGLPKARVFAILLFLLIAILFGFWVIYFVPVGNAGRIGVSTLITVGVIHFYFDSFIWSVRKKEI